MDLCRFECPVLGLPLYKKVIGITAGASTPDWIIDDVYQRIAELMDSPIPDEPEKLEVN